MVLCEFCGVNEAIYVNHYEEHKNVRPELYRGATRFLAKEIKKKAEKKIPGRINVCGVCHKILHGEQWYEGMRKAFSDKKRLE